METGDHAQAPVALGAEKGTPIADPYATGDLFHGPAFQLMKRGETRGLRLSIENAGGRGLNWAVISAPKWASPDRRSGELGYQETSE